MGVDVGVEKEVHGHPAGAGIDPMLCQRAVEVVRAVGVAGIPDVIIVFRSAGHGEGVMAADGVLHHFDQRHPILIVVFRMKARHGIGMAHQRAAGGYVQRMLNALVEFAGIKALEISALAAFDIDDLNVVACFDEIAFRCGGFHPQIKQRVGQGIGQVKLAHLARFGALHQKGNGRGGVLGIGRHRQAGGCHNQPAILERSQLGPCASRGIRRKKAQGTCAGQINAARRDAKAEPRQPSPKPCGQKGLQPARIAVGKLAQQRRINAAVRRCRHQFDWLAALIIDQRQTIPLPQTHHQRTAARHNMTLASVMAFQIKGCQDATGAWRPRKNGRIDGVEHGLPLREVLMALKLVHSQE